ncbi:hypothetical protein [Alicyclobacillus sp. ALC3]|uniref:hypothetical protein n=1 Tax=Alicyclobacillus sp. ALC3 TaxID=2796143 RepID=UPI0023781F67|nr:hypothetical protein [Alicyclobacillus sp. ALC3]WDL97737.1 hypothetical protein JC200_03120 [Alicyclobacillus sp. ALC3]
MASPTWSQIATTTTPSYVYNSSLIPGDSYQFKIQPILGGGTTDPMELSNIVDYGITATISSQSANSVVLQLTKPLYDGKTLVPNGTDLFTLGNGDPWFGYGSSSPTPVTNLHAIYNATNETITVSWTGTPANGDTFGPDTRWSQLVDAEGNEFDANFQYDSTTGQWTRMYA